MRFLVGFFCLPIGALAQDASKATEPTPRADRWALVVGVSKYDEAGLSILFGDRDADVIARDLVQYANFPEDRVFVLRGGQPDNPALCTSDQTKRVGPPTRKNIVNCIAHIAGNVSKAGFVFIFFSGHEAMVEKETYLLAQDSSASSDPCRISHLGIGADVLATPLRTRAVEAAGRPGGRDCLGEAGRNGAVSSAGPGEPEQAFRFRNNPGAYS